MPLTFIVLNAAPAGRSLAFIFGSRRASRSSLAYAVAARFMPPQKSLRRARSAVRRLVSVVSRSVSHAALPRSFSGFFPDRFRIAASSPHSEVCSPKISQKRERLIFKFFGPFAARFASSQFSLARLKIAISL